MKIREWLKNNPVEALTVSGSASLEEAAVILLENPEARDLFVLDDEGKLCGHLDFWHLASLLLTELRPSHSLRELVESITLGKVADHMDDNAMYIDIDEDIENLLYQQGGFQQNIEIRIEDIPVVDKHKRLLGVVRLADLLKDAINNTQN